MALEAFINGDREKKGKKRGRTLRFDLQLAPPTEEFTNEFSYTELVEGERNKVSVWVPHGAQNSLRRKIASDGSTPTSRPCGCHGGRPLEKPGFSRFRQNLTLVSVLQGEGPPKLGETLERGTDGHLAALAKKLEEKYGVRRTQLCVRVGFLCPILCACANNKFPRTNNDVIY